MEREGGGTWRERPGDDVCRQLIPSACSPPAFGLSGPTAQETRSNLRVSSPFCLYVVLLSSSDRIQVSSRSARTNADSRRRTD